MEKVKKQQIMAELPLHFLLIGYATSHHPSTITNTVTIIFKNI